MLDRFERFTQALSSVCAKVGTVFLLVILIMTFTDIIGSKFFLWPVPGSVEITGFLMVMLIPLAAALTMIYRQHVRLEIVAERLRKSTKRVVESIIYVILLCFFIIIIWQGFRYGMYFQSSKIIGSVTHWPVYYFAYVMAIAFIPLWFVFLLNFLKLLKGAKSQ